MNTPHQVKETPKQRLEHIARVSRPFRWELQGPNYLIAIALVLLLGIMIVVGTIGGSAAYDLFAEYARRISEWAWPS
jgi:hypothetical protein